LIAALLCGVAQSKAAAQAAGTVRGRITEATTHAGVGAARVTAEGTSRTATSRSDGSYALSDIAAGAHRLIITRSGFADAAIDVSVRAGDTTVADVVLTQLPVSLAAVKTVAGSGTLTVPSEAQATVAIARVPGAVAVISTETFKNGPASTIKDVLSWVPGVTTQTRWGPDARVSMRGSGLSRSYGNRGFNAYMDGIPLNTADGLVEFFEMDPTAYRYVEVYKGANALRYGANSLGGAIVFVTPTGRDAAPFEARLDAGSFGQMRGQASTGGAQGRFDYFVTASSEKSTGFREHSKGNMQRATGNVGFQFTPNIETRLYVNANDWHGRIPGEVTKSSALDSSKAANPFWVTSDQQRNAKSIRVADKTTFRLGSNTTLDAGAFTMHRHVDHPIFVYFDFTVDDFGGFARLSQDDTLSGHHNKFVIGTNIDNGQNNEQRYVNTGNATKGALISDAIDRSRNASAYFENSFSLVPNLSLIVGTQFLHATRTQIDHFLSNGDQSGTNSFDLWTPKGGLLWDVNPSVQFFGNVSRSAEVPTFDVNTFTSAANSNLRAQTATTFEIGTRGKYPRLNWDVALYRANIDHELQCLTGVATPGVCTVTNADKTVHQGVEAGFGVALLKSMFATNDRVWFNTTYTYNGFHFDNDSVYHNNRLPGVAPHLIRGELLYNGSRGFYVGPNVEWAPQPLYADNANTLTGNPYALLNLRAGLDLVRGWSIWAEGRNLSDKAYISTAAIVNKADPAGAVFNPGYGRAIYTGVRFIP
jgi:iron complex outermembrane receptor protein